MTNPDRERQGRVGEIIEANTLRFVAQCPRELLHAPPAFGSFVKALPTGADIPSGSPETPPSEPEDPFADPVPPSSAASPLSAPEGTLYAIVFSATTASADPGRRPTAYGLSEERLREEQPQIFDLLATEFAALHIGAIQGGYARLRLPPRPPRLHAFVHACSPEEVRALTETPEFLRPLLNVHEVDPDELVAACLRHVHDCRQQDFAYLVRVGKQLALLLRDNPERLTALLRKLEP